MHSIIPELLPLDRPLIVFDLETTGLTIGEDRIIELAYEKILPTGETSTKVYRINPGMPIPGEASLIHGIFDKDVALEPSFAKLSYELWNMFDGADFSGFNVIGFDLPFLRAEFSRVGKNFDFLSKRILDAKIIYHKLEPRNMFAPRNLTAAYKLYCGKEHTNAHTGEGDVRATVEILEKQLTKYPELRDWKYLASLHGNAELMDSAKNEHAPLIADHSSNTLF